MNTPNTQRHLSLRLLEPVRNPRLAVGESVDVRIALKAEGLESCRTRLHFDHGVFDELTGLPTDLSVRPITNPQEHSWTLRMKQIPAHPPLVEVTVEGDGLIQVAQFTVEVI